MENEYEACKISDNGGRGIADAFGDRRLAALNAEYEQMMAQVNAAGMNTRDRGMVLCGNSMINP